METMRVSQMSAKEKEIDAEIREIEKRKVTRDLILSYALSLL